MTHAVLLPLLLALSLRPMSMLSFRGERLTERKLDSVAVIRLPASIKEELLKGLRAEQPDRLAFTFGTSYLWASFGSVTRYKQLLVVSLMAREATDKSWSAYPSAFNISHENRHLVRSTRSGSISVTVTAGTYQLGSSEETAHIYEYRDTSRRLQIVWHAVQKEVPLNKGLELLDEMDASFRIVADPVATFADMRDRPRSEAADRARKRALTQQMLAQAGYTGLVPGRPVLKDDMYLEWMSDPEPRFQLLVPLGRAKAASATGGIPPRPTPPAGRAVAPLLAGTIGWWSFTDGVWAFNNGDNDYLPFAGVAALLKAKHGDRGEVLYYYSVTVRVEEAADERLTSLRWFTDGIPEVRRLWRDGKLVQGTIRNAPDDLH